MTRPHSERVTVAGGIWGLVAFMVALGIGVYPFAAELAALGGFTLGATVAHKTTRKR